jgi:redox-sensitive bicupin YhaK (pirin superfamily)
MNTNSLSQPRGVERIITGQATSDGAGVKLTRVLTQNLQRRLDPFLMLDAFGTDNPGDYIGGFPDHPHRGFETVSYMLDGRMRHRDSVGNEGVIAGGGVQWMTAGRGVIHSEMPEQEAGRMEGFQLWLNLPAKDKMSPPWYRDIPAAEIPEVQTPQGVGVRIIAGTSHGVAGAMQREATQPLYLDLSVPAGAQFEQPLPASHNAFVYVYRGELLVAGQAPAHGHPGQHTRQRRRAPEGRGGRRARHPHCRAAAERADRAVRALRHEQQRGDLPGGRGLSRRPPGLRPVTPRPARPSRRPRGP